MPRVYDREGNPVETTLEDLPGKIAQGYLAPSTETFRIVMPHDGKTYDVPGDKLDRAFKAGGRVESLQELESRKRKQILDNAGLFEMPFIGPEANQVLKRVSDQATALGSGVLGGATFGFTDWAIPKVAGLLGEENPQEIQKALKEEYPLSHLAGEVSGLVVPAVLPIPGSRVAAGAKAGKVAQLIGKLPAALASKAGMKVASKVISLGAGKGRVAEGLAGYYGYGAAGAIEGGLYGLGTGIANELNEGDLWSPEGVSEVIGGDMLQGALFGFAGGATVSGLSSIAKPTFRGFSNLTKKVASKVDDKLQNIGKSDASIAEALNINPSKIPADKWDEVIKPSLLDDTMLPDGAIVNGKTKQYINRFEEAFKIHGSATNQVQKSLDDLVAAVEATSPELGTLKPNISRLKETLEELIPQYKLEGTASESNSLGRELFRIHKGLKKTLNKNEHSYKYLLNIRDSYRTASKFDATKPANRTKAFKKLYRAVTEDINSSADKLLSHAKGTQAYDDLLVKLRDELKLENVDDVMKLYKESSQKFHRLATIAEKSKSETLANRLSSNSLFDNFAKSFQFQMMIGRPITSALPRSATIVAARELPTYRQALKQKFFDWVINNSEGKERNLIKLISNGYLKAKPTAAKAFKGAGVPVSLSIYNSLVPRKERNEAFREIIKIIHKRIENPQMLIESIKNIMPEFLDYAPQTSDAMIMKHGQLMNKLVKSIPKGAPTNPYQPHLDIIEPTEEQLDKFGMVLAAAFKPEKLLEDVISGQADPEALEILQETHPLWWEAVKTNIIAAISQRSDKLSTEEVNRLQFILGDPNHALYAARSQEIYVDRQQQGDRAANTAPGRPVSEKAIEQYTNRSLSDGSNTII